MLPFGDLKTLHANRFPQAPPQQMTGRNAACGLLMFFENQPLYTTTG